MPIDANLGTTHKGKTFDKLLELAATDTTLATAGTTAVYIGNGLVDADLVLDVSSVTAAEGGVAGVKLQFCDDSAFASGTVDGPTVPLGASFVGRVVAPFRNDANGKSPLAYVRLVPTGTVKAGAFIAKK